MARKIRRREPSNLNIEYIADVLPHEGHWGHRALSAIDRIIIHHSDGWTSSTSRDTALVHINERGWHGMAYQYEVPYHLAGDPPGTCYQTQPLDAWTYHTGKEWNEHGIAILVRGGFHSRHCADRKWTLPRPTEDQIATLHRLVRYLMAELNVKLVYGHCHAGKPACPGDYLERWISRFQMS